MTSPEGLTTLLWVLAAWGAGFALYAALRGLEELVTLRRRRRDWRGYMLARALWRPAERRRRRG